MLAIVCTTWLFTTTYFKVKEFMADQTIGDPNDPNNPYRYTTVKEFNENWVFKKAYRMWCLTSG